MPVMATEYNRVIPAKAGMKNFKKCWIPGRALLARNDKIILKETL